MLKKILTLIIFFIFSLGSYAQTITTQPLTGTYAAGNSINVRFTTNFNISSNYLSSFTIYYFIVELSDINGSFASPTRISFVNSGTCGVTSIGESIVSDSYTTGTVFTITGNLPLLISPSNNYRVRVNSVQRININIPNCYYSTVTATMVSTPIIVVAAENKHVIHNNSTSVLILPNSIQTKEVNYENLSNTSIGNNALRNTQYQSNNTSLGYEAGINNQGSSNTFLGSKSNATSVGYFTNSTAIGFEAEVSTSNKIRLGNTAITVIEGQVPYTYPSDRRLKENIFYTDRLGLNLISRLNTVSYNYKSDASKVRRDGLIAQDLKHILQELNMPFSGLAEGSDANKTLTLASSELVFPLINAVKELNQKIDLLEKHNQKLEAMISNIYQSIQNKDKTLTR